MDTSFTFPRQLAPTPRPTPASPAGGANTINRQSNALRASILDAALTLGIGNNNLVSDWMFNHSLAEEDEGDQRSPALTYGSTDESSFSGGIGRYPSTSSSSHASSNHDAFNSKSAQAPDASIFAVPESHVHFDKSVDDIRARQPPGSDVPFPDISVPQSPVMPVRGKLRKKRGDGYESDGGCLSDGEKKDNEKKKSGAKDDVDKKDRKEAKARAKEEKLQEKREKEEVRKRKKSLGKTMKGQGEDKDGYTTGYETDTSKPGKSLKKSKSKISADAGYETDSGYLSLTPGKKSKGRFFKLVSKQSKPDLRQEEVPALPAAFVAVPLPIASRFATTTGAASSSANDSLASMSTTTMNSPAIPPILEMATAPAPSTPSSTTSLQSPISQARSGPDHRESYGSAESGGSALASPATARSKRREFQFLHQDHRHVTSPTQTRLPPSAVNSPMSLNNAFPAIFLPFKQTLSSSSPQGSYPPQQPSPMRISSSPLEALTPPLIPVSRPPPSSPRLSVPRPQILQATSSSPSPLGVRPRFPPTDGFGPRPPPASPLPPSPFPPSPSSFLRFPSTDPTGTRISSTRYDDRPNLVIVPSTSYIVPSPPTSPLISPNVLAYYAIPPPSPPPAGPLPSIPPPGSFGQTPTRSGGGSISNIARSRIPDQGIQRGREAPFPARPILPSPASTTVGGGVGPGLEACVKVLRYRELYGLPLSPQDPEHNRRSTPSPTVEQNQESRLDIDVLESSDGGWDEAGYDERNEEGMRDVLECFEEARMDASGRGRGGAKVLGRNRSFEAIHNRIAGADYSVSDYHSEDSHESDDVVRRSSTEEGGANRKSRWSGSIYSRVSVLDPDKSKETRQRFIYRVEAMYGERDAVPPIPKLSEAVIGAGAPSPGRSWNRI